ncbi:MAG TPA: GntR family transcriptional regulator [Anaerolineales bacterium]|nr:GntR family transcriptional regulator [Anaerolineales bacterium]
MPFLGDISQHQLRNVVVDQIREAILDGRYKPGTWLRQEHIAQELNVSQMPVREALKELAALGLVEYMPYRGVRVMEFSAEDVADLYAVRAFLESRAAGIAAKQITGEEIQQLKVLQGEIDQNHAPQNILQYRELNRRFHEMIYTASRRPYLTRTLNQLWAAFPSMLIGNFARTANAPLAGREDTDSQEHLAILAALEQRDTPAAEQAMRVHIEAVLNNFVDMLSNR